MFLLTRLIIRIFVILILSWLININLTGQTADSIRPEYYGLTASYSYNFHNADFRALPGFPNCCPRFSSGEGGGFNAGLLYGFPVFNIFKFEGRLEYNYINGIMTNDEYKTVLDDALVQEGLIRHHLESKIHLISFSPRLGYEIFSSAYIQLGLEFAGLAGAAFVQYEELVESSGKTFENNSRIRNQFSDNIPQTVSFYFGGIIGGGYSVPLNKTKNMSLSAEFFYKPFFNQVVNDLTWSVSSLSLGLVLRYSPIISKPEPAKYYEKKINTDTIKLVTEIKPSSSFIKGNERISFDTAKTEESIIYYTKISRTDTIFNYNPPTVLKASIKAFGVEPDGKENEVVTIRTEQFLTTLMTPLLNYIFFDDGSSELSPKYKRKPDNINTFNIDSVNSENKLETYYQILNIIGKRMIDNPGAKLKITGCNSNLGIEKDNKKLSEKRAEIVRDYFLNTWKIEPGRLKTEVRNLPENPSTSSDNDGIQENRRVELYSSSYEILKPIITVDTLVSVTPMTVRFKPVVIAEAGLKSWKISANQKNTEIKTFVGSASIAPEYDWDISNDVNIKTKFDTAISYSIKAEDSKGQVRDDSHLIRTENVTIQKKRHELLNDKEIERYSLILFEVNAYQIKDINAKIVEFVKLRIRENSTVKITGYTDRLGNAESNHNLSKNRAKFTANALKVEKTANIEGVGDKIKLFDNDIPEGRFYCRTVDIIIETPVK